MEGGPTPSTKTMAPSGSYILIVVGQPMTEDHKKIILERLEKGLSSCDFESIGCDFRGLEATCSDINEKNVSDSDVLLQYSTESLGVEVLFSPSVSTLKQCVRNLFSTPTSHKHLIHSGYTFAGSGSWVLQNGTFSFDDFLDIFQQASVQNKKRCSIHIHCAQLGPWNAASFAKDAFSGMGNISFNPPEKEHRIPGSEHLLHCLARVISHQSPEDLMEGSSLIGNIRFNRPTLYVFPAGQGDCALFGVSGFNMLVDGGFTRKPCSWEFIRHLDRVDAVLVTRLCESNVCGMSTLMKRKLLNNSYPKIGYVFCNVAENRLPSPQDEEVKLKDELTISVVGEGHSFTNTLNELKLKPHNCWKDSSVEPFVLYHKVGQGTLEMHILSPPKDSKEMKEFLIEWSSYKESISSKKSGIKGIPLSHSTSICGVLVWRPDDPKDTISRILFTGSAPQNKILDSLEKLKSIDIFKHPTVSKAFLAKTPKIMTNKVEKGVIRSSAPNRKMASSPAHSVSSVASRNGDAGNLSKENKEKETRSFIKKESATKHTKKETPNKELKKDNKTNGVLKKDVVLKKEVPKEKKEKPIIKKEIKDIKPSVDKKSDIKVKKVETLSKIAPEVKKTTSSPVKRNVIASKKDANKTPTVSKSSEPKKPQSKVSESKTAKEDNNKKIVDPKVSTKSKLKTTNSTSKPKADISSSKTLNKLTKVSVVAATSIVASAVAVPTAALQLTERREELMDEIESVNISEKEIEVDDLKEGDIDKPAELVVSPVPPEALSPTPSESVSLTRSDTLSSAPLETVSPTPPPGNEIVDVDFVDEKEVNEIKSIERDVCDEEIADEYLGDQMKQEENDIERQLNHHQQHSDIMSTSFIASNEELPGNEEVCKESILETYVQLPNDENVEETNEDITEYEKENYEVCEKETNIDEKLKNLSMEGSFCAGYEQGKPDIFQLESNVESVDFNTSNKIEPCEISDKVDQPQPIEVVDNYDTETQNACEELKHKNHISADEYNDFDSQAQSEVKVSDSHETGAISDKYQTDNISETDQDQYESQNYEQYDRLTDLLPSKLPDPTIQSYPTTQDIIADDEMQETSVDEPEEYMQREFSSGYQQDSANNKHQGKYSTEFEDEDGLQYNDERESLNGCDQYEKHDIENNRSIHADVYYKNDDIDTEKNVEFSIEKEMLEKKESSFANEKDDFDEKDRDSTEEQEDIDDGEMIRHPTPPFMKYSEEEMRDPIGPHIIKTPGMNQIVSDITEEPLYEEQEDDDSVRSQSPIAEQPVFGNVVGADFPELVTVSGGTTPSEPQSPKVFDKKFSSEAVTMDALSEHDCSESSSHSPLCQDGAKIFELLPEDKLNQQIDSSDLVLGEIDEARCLNEIGNQESSSICHQIIDNTSDDESFSQNEKSETRSEKSEVADDEKNDDKSDIQGSDKSDHHHDGQPDFHNDQNEKRFDDDSNYDDKDGCNDNGGADNDSNTDSQNYSSNVGAVNYHTEPDMQFEEKFKDSNISYSNTDHYTAFSNEIKDTYDDEDASHKKPLTTISQNSPLENFEIDIKFGSETNVKTSNLYHITESEENVRSHVDYSNEYKIPSDFQDNYLVQSLDFEKSNIDKIQNSDNDLANTELDSHNIDYNADKLSYNTFEELDGYSKTDSSKDRSSQEVDKQNFTVEEFRSTFNSNDTDNIISNQYGDVIQECVTSHMYQDTTKSETIENNQPYAYESNMHSCGVSYNETLAKEQVDGNKLETSHEFSDGSLDAKYSNDIADSHLDNYHSKFASEEKYSNELSSDTGISSFPDENKLISGDDIKSSSDMLQHFDYQEDSNSGNEYNLTKIQSDKDSELYSNIPSAVEMSLKGEQANVWETETNISTIYSIKETEESKLTSTLCQENSDIINSRFHSDSPEDNVMRNDYSPDVPYPSNPMGQLSNLESNIVHEEFTNINRSNIDERLPAKKVRDLDNPYYESSEDEDSASPPGTVSPYAYTNEAYTKEEEDIDGNHIYKESVALGKTEIRKEVDFDGNNPQNVTAQQVSYSQEPGYGSGTNYEFRLEEWGKPMGLPTPLDSSNKTVVKKSEKVTTKTIKTSSDTNGKAYPSVVSSKLSSPLKKPKTKESASSPIYVDLAYVPHHGDPQYCDVEFFKKVRARYYVFSSISPSKEVLNALLEGKKSWKEDLEVTIIPTYETDTLGYWMAQNKEELEEYSIDIAPSASRCTVNLQDHETSCSAYRLEF